MAAICFSPGLLRRNPFQRIRHIPGQPISYLQNPKVACTSIELTLWRAHDPKRTPDNPHSTKVRPFIKNARKVAPESVESLLASEFFSVVRNPYSRLLSAYLDKVGAGKRPWMRISQSLGLPPDSDPSLLELLSAIQACDPLEIDHHFRPQTVNLLHGFAPIEFLGYMERMDAVSAFLRRHGFNLERYEKNATTAAVGVEALIGPKEAESICRYYVADFEIYGYADDPGKKEPVREPMALNTSRAPLRKFIEQRAVVAAGQSLS